MPNWKNTFSRDKLMAAWLASINTTPNYSQIAKYFGEDATYHSIEGQFRPLRKLADKLKHDLENGTTTVTSTMGDGANGATVAAPTPRRAALAANGAGSGSRGGKRGAAKKDGVITGRVTKPEAATPAKQPLAPKRDNSVMGIKEEVVSSSEGATPDESFLWGADVDGGEDGIGLSFDNGTLEDHLFGQAV